MQNIENIIFDLGGVILDIDYNLTRVAFEKLGVLHFNEMYSLATADKLFKNLEIGTISEEYFYQEFNNCTGLNLTADEIRVAWNAMLLSFREESLKFLSSVGTRYRIFLLSNTNFIHLNSFKKIFHQQKREKLFEEYFEQAFYSCEIGWRKPDTECYNWVIKKLNIDPNRTLFIDDSQFNIEGAKKAGLQTIQLLPGMKIEDLGL